MPWGNTAARWGHLAQLLHWLVVLLVVTQFVLANMADNAEGFMAKLQLLARHKSVGITILALTLLRLGWRLGQPVPALPATMPAWQMLASRASHVLLYGLLLALPITGWLMSSAANFPVSWFGWFTLPDLVAPDEALKETLVTVHETLAKVLFAVALLHLAAALKHHLLDRDDVLRRMLPFTSLLLLALTGTTGWQPANAESTPARWQLDPAESFIRFSAVQAGARFTGSFTRFDAQVHFAGNDLANSTAKVRIPLASVDTSNTERDEILAGPEWFAISRQPEAVFTAGPFRQEADGDFVTTGTLAIAGNSQPVTFRFKVRQQGNQQVLTGNARLDRLALGLGLGEWQDTQWIGQYVDVQVRLVARLGDDPAGVPGSLARTD